MRALSSVIFGVSVSVSAMSRSARLISCVQCPLSDFLTALLCPSSAFDIRKRVSAPVSEIFH